MRALALVSLLAGCTGEDSEDTGPGAPPLDPDAMSWSPATAPLPAAERVIFFGDSITAGYGISNSANTYASLLIENNAQAWPEYGSDDLIARYGDVEVLDFSRSGAETNEVLGNQIASMDAFLGGPAPGPTLVFITIGGNDITAALATGGLATVADDIEANIEAIAEVFSDSTRFPDGAQLLLTNVYEPTDGLGQADQCFLGLDVSAAEPVLDDVNARTLALAQDMGFAWVDLRGHFRGHGWNHENTSMPTYDEADPTLWLQEDCIHPNRRGHHELRRLFLAAVDGEPLVLETP